MHSAGCLPSSELINACRLWSSNNSAARVKVTAELPFNVYGS